MPFTYEKTEVQLSNLSKITEFVRIGTMNLGRSGKGGPLLEALCFGMPTSKCFNFLSGDWDQLGPAVLSGQNALGLDGELHGSWTYFFSSKCSPTLFPASGSTGSWGAAKLTLMGNKKLAQKWVPGQGLDKWITPTGFCWISWDWATRMEDSGGSYPTHRPYPRLRDTGSTANTWPWATCLSPCIMTCLFVSTMVSLNSLQHLRMVGAVVFYPPTLCTHTLSSISTSCFQLHQKSHHNYPVLLQLMEQNQLRPTTLLNTVACICCDVTTWSLCTCCPAAWISFILLSNFHFLSSDSSGKPSLVPPAFPSRGLVFFGVTLCLYLFW